MRSLVLLATLVLLCSVSNVKAVALLGDTFPVFFTVGDPGPCYLIGGTFTSNRQPYVVSGDEELYGFNLMLADSNLEDGTYIFTITADSIGDYVPDSGTQRAQIVVTLQGLSGGDQVYSVSTRVTDTGPVVGQTIKGTGTITAEWQTLGSILFARNNRIGMYYDTYSINVFSGPLMELVLSNTHQ
jgi:hypothetical protein